MNLSKLSNPFQALLPASAGRVSFGVRACKARLTVVLASILVGASVVWLCVVAITYIYSLLLRLLFTENVNIEEPEIYASQKEEIVPPSEAEQPDKKNEPLMYNVRYLPAEDLIEAKLHKRILERQEKISQSLAYKPATSTVQVNLDVAEQYIQQWELYLERFGNTKYSRELAKLNGEVRVAVELAANGTLINVRVVEPSPNPQLDSLALRIVQEVGSFKPFPRDLAAEDSQISFERILSFEKRQ